MVQYVSVCMCVHVCVCVGSVIYHILREYMIICHLQHINTTSFDLKRKQEGAEPSRTTVKKKITEGKEKGSMGGIEGGVHLVYSTMKHTSRERHGIITPGVHITHSNTDGPWGEEQQKGKTKWHE